MNYITIESVDEYLTKVEKLGGKILLLKQQVSTVGRIAVPVDRRKTVWAVAARTDIKCWTGIS